jgi:hypothetical protein
VRYAWLLLAVGCANDLDPRWQLDHDRIVAIRSTPPHVPAGGTATLDALIAHESAPTTIDKPTAAAVVTPEELASAVAPDGTITAPADIPMPIGMIVGVTFGDLVATKDVTLGDTADNPTLGAVTIDGAPAPAADISIAPDVDVQLEIDEPDMAKVAWLTSCGTMHDDDEHHAFIHVNPDDPQSGELAVVVRTPDGGVAFQTWTIHAP